jgi:large subunit ribosomal protein L32
MPLPSFRSSRSKVRRRRSHHALKAVIIEKCKACKADMLAHHACPKCHNYNGRTAKGSVDAVARKLKLTKVAAPKAAKVAKAPKAPKSKKAE